MPASSAALTIRYLDYLGHGLGHEAQVVISVSEALQLDDTHIWPSRVSRLANVVRSSCARDGSSYRTQQHWKELPSWCVAIGTWQLVNDRQSRCDALPHIVVCGSLLLPLKVCFMSTRKYRELAVRSGHYVSDMVRKPPAVDAVFHTSPEPIFQSHTSGIHRGREVTEK